jgi:small subunit ribosomal protein S20
VATHKSSEKRARQAIKRTARNTGLSSRVKTVVRDFRETLTKGDRTAALAALNVATRELQKAGSKGLLKKETVSRRVSRLNLAFNALSA